MTRDILLGLVCFGAGFTLCVLTLVPCRLSDNLPDLWREIKWRLRGRRC